MKRCGKCRKTKDEAEFRKDRSTSDGYDNRCKVCRKKHLNVEKFNECARRYRANNKRKIKSRKYKSAYGLTLEELEVMLETQGGCGICKKHIKFGNQMGAHVDHCHETGRVRGILCPKCNQALGCLGDNEEGLLRALEYLRG